MHPVNPTEPTPEPAGSPLPAPHTPPAKSRVKPAFVVGGAAIVVAALAVTLWLVLSGGSITVKGGIEVPAATDFEGGCRTYGGYTDIHEGAEVLVRNQDGAVVATGKLHKGIYEGDLCLFPFTVADVPSGEDFYEVTVGDRGGPHFTEEEMEAGVELVLG